VKRRNCIIHLKRAGAVKKNHTQYQNTLENTLSDIVIKKTRVKADIVFGSPSTGCKGSGVCTVIPIFQGRSNLKCPSATAWISMVNKKKIRFAFLKSSMTEQQIKCHFRWNLFQVFESVSMPFFVQKGIGANHQLIVKSGIYIVEERLLELIVDFNLDDC